MSFGGVMVNVMLVSGFLSSLTLLSDVVIALIVLLGIYKFASKKELSPSIGNLKFFFKDNAVLMALIVALIATAGSLFYSEIALYEPCKLCWLQRIFMYPLVLMFALALWKKDRRVFRYAVPMCIIGGLISAYHYITQLIQYSSSCGANSAVPCTVKYTFYFGYVTIPMMALIAFVLILILGYWASRR